MEVLNPQTPPPDAEQVFAYFLGELTAAQAEQFETQVFENEDLAEHVFALEDELIELYLRGELPPTRRTRFEEHYLTTDARHEKVEFAAALAQELAAPPMPSVATAPEPKAAWWQSLFVTSRLAWAVVLLLAVVGGWSWLTRSRELKPVDIVQTASPPQASRSVPPTATPSVGGTPLPRVTPTAPPSRPPVVPAVVALTLAPGLPLSSGQALPVLQLPAKATAADLTLQLYRADFRRYRAVLQTGGATVWTAHGLRAHAKADGTAEVSVRVPARRLKPADYLLQLYGTEQGAPVSSYSFSVRAD